MANGSKQKDLELFLGVYENLSKELVEELKPLYEVPEESVAWIKEMVDYNVKGGKLNRGLTVLHAARSIVKARDGEELSPELAKKACILGWCIEWLQAFFLVADDVMDQSHTRRGQPCWYKLPKVGNTAINDSFILESQIYRMLKTHFRSEKSYVDLLELFHEVTYQTEIGQLLDTTAQPLDKPVDLNRFTSERHHSIVKYKTSFYSFYLPVACGMIIGGITDTAAFDVAKEICVKMGVYFQIQDDYLDCYADPEVLGKVGTDIQDTKCSWLVTQALARATPKQKEILLENYGKDVPEKIQAVKQLYAEMDLEGSFHKYEAESYEEIKGLINDVKSMPQEVFLDLLAKIYKRSK